MSASRLAPNPSGIMPPFSPVEMDRRREQFLDHLVRQSVQEEPCSSRYQIRARPSPQARVIRLDVGTRFEL